MKVTDIEILKQFSKDWEDAVCITAIHSQEKYGKPLDKEYALDCLEFSKFYGFDEDIPAIEKLINKYFPNGDETYDVSVYINSLYPEPD